MALVAGRNAPLGCLFFFIGLSSSPRPCCEHVIRSDEFDGEKHRVRGITESEANVRLTEAKNMHADAAEMQGSKAQKQGGKTRLLTLADLDSRTRACKHALGLRGNFPCQNAR